eukprot:365958-Chlamydomonas_euryale.AAC.1
MHGKVACNLSCVAPTVYLASSWRPPAPAFAPPLSLRLLRRTHCPFCTITSSPEQAVFRQHIGRPPAHALPNCLQGIVWDKPTAIPRGKLFRCTSTRCQGCDVARLAA